MNVDCIPRRLGAYFFDVFFTDYFIVKQSVDGRDYGILLLLGLGGTGVCSEQLESTIIHEESQEVGLEVFVVAPFSRVGVRGRIEFRLKGLVFERRPLVTRVVYYGVDPDVPFLQWC